MKHRILSFTAMAGSMAFVNSAVVQAPGQPSERGVLGGFKIIGESPVSAEGMFLGTSDKVYLLDKVENNPTQVNGRAASASEYAVDSNGNRAMDISPNSFCSSGSVLGNGTWVNIGGNGAPTTSSDGRRAIRMLNPCDDSNCNWSASPAKYEQRWYSSMETLKDGSVIILGGASGDGYFNDPTRNNPTYEFFPPTPNGHPISSTILTNTLPANYHPLIWLVPSGRLLIQSNWATALLNTTSKKEIPLDNVPDAVRTYPAGAGSVMLPMTPLNNWTATIMSCGGLNVPPEAWGAPDFNPMQLSASVSCVKLMPDSSGNYFHDEDLPEGRIMMNMINLPDGKILALNGGRKGSAGYGSQPWAVGQSYADDPVLLPLLYNPHAHTGRWSSDGLSPSTISRLYSSSATLLPDGSVLVAGSNPNMDVTNDPNVKYPTEYRMEKFYPPYYNTRRPQPKGLPSSLSYGGPAFEVWLDKDDLFGDVRSVENATVVVIRPGFSTHSRNMGQRYVQLQSTYTGFKNTTAVLHVSQLPPNPAILAPGPALIFVVVNGIPSIGVPIMVGSGKIEQQKVSPVGGFPSSSIFAVQQDGVVPKHKTSGGEESRRRLGDALCEWLLVFVSAVVLGW